ncbi:hypothetical protein AB1Y20_021170 [Prymnesium parvum]|uniref:Potassium channel domain-containing protein n=1 Tax=Prymnesium parvum TaxID=97485 RepID=A0AB34JIV1_PRYPA
MLLTEEDVLPQYLREHTSLDPASFTLSTFSIALVLFLSLHILDLVLAGELTSTARLSALIRWSERKIPVASMYVNEQREHERLEHENSSFVNKYKRHLATFVVVNRMLQARPASQPPPISVGEMSVFEIWRFRLLALAQPPRAHSTILLRATWLVTYLVYASYSRREACFISPGSATQCDDWETDRAPWWLYCCDVVLLWSFSLRMFARSLFLSKAHDGRSRGIFLTHLQLPVVLLLWREIWLLAQRANTRKPLVHISMQLGWLRLLLFFRSRMMEFAAQRLLTTHTQARLFMTAVNLVSIVLFFSGLIHFLLGSTKLCGALPTVNDTAFENVIVARTEAAKHLSGGFPELMDHIDLGCELANVYTLHDYIYFTIVTISTVGYGDFYPPDGITRTVAVTLMLVLLTYIPLEFSNLIAMLNEMRHFCIGTPPTRWNAVVALIGPISAQQLSMFLFDFFQGNHNLDPNARIVVLSPLPLSEYHPVVKHWRARSSAAHIRRLYIDCNDVLSMSKKGKVPVQIAEAKAIFVFSDSEAPKALAEDRHTVVRCLVLRKLLPAPRMRIVSVQFNRAMDKALAMEMGVRSAIALNELKMALLAVSATRCFGLTTLLCNMLRPQKQLPQANHPAAGTGSLDEYLVGVAYGPYLVELPKCCIGRPWKELVESLFVELQIVLLGRVRAFAPCTNGETSVQQHRDDVLETTVSSIELAYEQSVNNVAVGARNSGGGGGPMRTPCVPHNLLLLARSDSSFESQGDTDGRSAERNITYLEVEPCSLSAVEPHCFALVLAPSAEVAELLRLLPRLPQHMAVATEQDEEGVRAARKKWQELLKKEAAQAGSLDRQESFTKWENADQPFNKEPSQSSKNEPSQPKNRAPAGGLGKGFANVIAHEVYAEQSEQIFISDEDAIESEHVGQRPFVLAVCGAWPANLRIFVETVIGEGQYAVVLLCSVPPPTTSDKHMLCAYVNDEKQPLVHVVIGDVRSQQQLFRAGMQYARSIVVLSSFRGTGVSAEETITDPNQCDMGVALLHAKIQKAIMALAHAEGRSARRIPVLTEVHHANASRFLDETSWWPEDELDDFAFVQAPAYASGRCFAESMLYPLVNYSYFMPLLMLLMQEILQIQDHDACFHTVEQGWP